MTPEKQEQAVKWLTEEIRSLRMAPAINGCGPENWADQLEVMETCLEAVMWNGDEPLTLEQLRKKVGQPVVIKYSYGGPNTVAIVDVRYVPHLGADKIRLVFPDGYITVNEKDYGTYFTTYAYPPAHIDREAWTAEWRNHYRSGATAGTGYVCSSCDMWNGRKSHICPSCGKAMDEDGLSELEKRLRG